MYVYMHLNKIIKMNKIKKKQLEKRETKQLNSIKKFFYFLLVLFTKQNIK